MTSARSRAPSRSNSALGRVLREAAAHEVWVAFDLAGLFVDGDDRHEESVLGEVPAIAQHLVDDFAGTGSIDQHTPRRRLSRDGGAVRRSAGRRRFRSA